MTIIDYGMRAFRTNFPVLPAGRYMVSIAEIEPIPIPNTIDCEYLELTLIVIGERTPYFGSVFAEWIEYKTYDPKTYAAANRRLQEIGAAVGLTEPPTSTYQLKHKPLYIDVVLTPHKSRPGVFFNTIIGFSSVFPPDAGKRAAMH